MLCLLLLKNEDKDMSYVGEHMLSFIAFYEKKLRQYDKVW